MRKKKNPFVGDLKPAQERKVRFLASADKLLIIASVDFRLVLSLHLAYLIEPERSHKPNHNLILEDVFSKCTHSFQCATSKFIIVHLILRNVSNIMPCTN